MMTILHGKTKKSLHEGMNHLIQKNNISLNERKRTDGWIIVWIFKG